MSGTYSAGTPSRSDCVASYRKGSGPLELRVESTISPLFDKAIRARALRVAQSFGATGILAIVDNGALDHVVAARTEAALVLAGLQTPLPPAWPQIQVPPGGSRNRLRRSRLYLPANQAELAVNSGLFGADCLILDLEDSVDEGRKLEARILARVLLSESRGFFGSSELAVRINCLDGPHASADLASIVPFAPHAIVLPKCESAELVHECDLEVTRLERDAGLPAGSILFMPIVETARGVMAALSIAAASPRCVTLGFGAEDFRRDLGVERQSDEGETAVARGLVALAARAAGVEAQDSVYPDLEDLAGLEASVRRAKALGFSGKGLIHPSQIEIVHRVFAPSPEDIQKARRVLAAMHAARIEGRGAVAIDGIMIDAPAFARASRILSLAGLAPEQHDGLQPVEA